MAKKKVRVAVIGCGAIGTRRHLPEYANRSDVEIVGVCDIVKARAEAAAEQFSAPAAFTEYKQMLKEAQPDAVSVCTPNALHAPMTVDALKAGAHVLCEKPMAGSVTDARKMLRAAKSAGRQLMIGHNQRLAPSHVRGKAIYQSGELGQCIAFSTTFAHGGPEGWSVDGMKGFFFKKDQAIIGALGDLGVHKIDLIRWLLEDEITQVCAMCDTLVKKPCSVDDTAFAVLRMKSGALGQMFAGWGHRPGENNATILHCENGRIRLNHDPDFTVIVERPSGERDFIQTRKMQTNVAGGQFGSGVIDTFVDAIQSGKPNPIPGEEGARSLAAVMACLESSQQKKFIRPKNV